MQKINLINYDMKEIILDCIDNYQNSSLKQRFKNNIQRFIDNTNLINEKMEKNELHTLKKNEVLYDDLTSDELKKLYTRKFAKQNEGGRKYYNKILQSVNNENCPYCKTRQVRELDHFLPQSSYPSFTVSPNNLVPSCRSCNKDKLATNIDSYETTPFHPYFDDFSKYLWLESIINIENNEIFINYYVCTDNINDPLDCLRIENTFKIFNLNSIYSFNGINELLGKEFQFSNLIQKSGSNILKEQIYSSLESFEYEDKNSWQSALFRELYTNDDIYTYYQSISI